MITLRPWSKEDRVVLDSTVGDPTMMRYLGGAEDRISLDRRHQKYLTLSAAGTGQMFVILTGPERLVAGTVGYWQRRWNEDDVYESGWQVVRAHAGRGIATQAARAVISILRAAHGRRFLHAFPSIENVASNRVCEGAGYSNLGVTRFEYPKGSRMICHDWRYDLDAER